MRGIGHVLPWPGNATAEGGSDGRKRKRTGKAKKKATPATSLPSSQPPPSTHRIGPGAGRGVTSGRGVQQQRPAQSGEDGAVVLPGSGLPLPTLPPPPAPLVPVGGRLASFADKLEEITDDAYVLSIVKRGYVIPFKTPPCLTTKPVYFPVKDISHTSMLQSAVEELLGKRAVEIVEDQTSPSFYSRIFLVRKKNGKYRPVIDLSPLNKSIELEHFKMETQKTLRLAIRRDFWTVSIDLQDAYLHVPIRRSCRKFLRFALNNKVYQFC